MHFGLHTSWNIGLMVSLNMSLNISSKISSNISLKAGLAFAWELVLEKVYRTKQPVLVYNDYWLA